MKKNFLTIAMLAAFFITSCNNAPTQETEATDFIENADDNIVTTTSTDQDGNTLDITFDNNKNTATITFNGETSELIAERAASGIWYTNEEYELRGKGNDITLSKHGNVVYDYQEEIIQTSYTNDKGETLDLTVNNTTNEAKIYLNGGEQIKLKGQNPASGIWFKNDQYELSGKGEKLELTKDGEVVFKN